MDKAERSPSCGHERAKRDPQARCGGQEKIEGSAEKKIVCEKNLKRNNINPSYPLISSAFDSSFHT